MTSRRQALTGLLVFAAGTSAIGKEGDWPTRPVRIVVPFTAGSPPDMIARVIAPKLGASLGQPIVVDNKPGATTTIGTELVARSSPDGYTLLLTATGAASVFPAIMKLRYDPIKDLTPVGMLAISQQIFFTSPLRKITTLKEYIAYARQNPDKANMGSIGIGTTNHLACEMLKKAGGIQATYVPYQSSQAGLQAVINGDIDLFCADIGVVLGLLGSDRITPLAVAGASRSEFLPGTPTLAEAGISGVLSANRFALFAPSGLPRTVAQRLAQVLPAAVNSEEAGNSFRKMGMTPSYTPADSVSEVIRSDADAMVPLARALNIRLD